MAIRFPLSSLKSSADMDDMSFPSKDIDPPVSAVVGKYPITANAEVDFPQPDSPTMPNTSPLETSKEASLTAVTVPLGVKNVTDKSSTLSNGSLFITSHLGPQGVGEIV